MENADSLLSAQQLRGIVEATASLFSRKIFEGHQHHTKDREIRIIIRVTTAFKIYI